MRRYNYNTVYFGHDAELTFIGEDGNFLLPRQEYLDKPEIGAHFVADNVNFEFNVRPRTTMQELIRDTHSILDKTCVILNSEPSALPIHDMTNENIFDGSIAVDYGCKPDINTIGISRGLNKEMLEELSKTDTRRPCGFHVHISCRYMFTEDDMSWREFIRIFTEYQESTPEEREEVENRIRNHPCWKPYTELSNDIEMLLLNISYCASLKYADSIGMSREEMVTLEAERRIKYGMQGNTRPKLYTGPEGELLQGVEIRSPSATLLFMDAKSKAVSVFNNAVINRVRYYTPYYKNPVARLRNFPNSIQYYDTLLGSELYIIVWRSKPSFYKPLDIIDKEYPIIAGTPFMDIALVKDWGSRKPKEIIQLLGGN